MIRGFRTVLGEEGPRLLAEAIASGQPADRHVAVSLLDADLDAARAAGPTLTSWMREEAEPELRVRMAALVLETDLTNPAALEVLRAGLRGGTSSVSAVVEQVIFRPRIAALVSGDLLEMLEERRDAGLRMNVIDVLQRESLNDAQRARL